MTRRRRNARKSSKSDTIAFSIANMEQIAVNESLGQEKGAPLDTPCRIHIHSKRKSLADADGISGKAAIDGLVHAGVLHDDSTKFVREVSFSQEKCKEEETIIIIYEDES